MKRIEFLLLAAVLVLNFGLRLYKLNNPIADWHSWRQADTSSVTRFYVRDGIDWLNPRYSDLSSVATGLENPNGFRFVEFPFYNAIVATLYNTFSHFTVEQWGRLVSIAFSTISALFIYLTGRRFLGTSGGLLSALFFAILPFNIYFSRVILPEPMAVAAVSSSLWFFIRWIDGKKWEIILSGLLFAIALLLKPYTVFYLIPFAYLAFARFGLKALLNIQLWLFLLSFVPLFLWRGFMNAMEFLPGIPFWKWAFNGDNIRFKPSFFWWLFEERLGKMILGTWGMFPFLSGFLEKIKGEFGLFIPVLFGSQVIYWATVATANVRHDYYQTLSIPAIVVVLAAGTQFLWNLPAQTGAKIGDEITRRSILIVSIVLGLAFSFYQIKENYKVNHPEIITAGLAVQRLTPQNAKVIAPYDGDTAFLYQTDRSGWPFITLPIDQMIRRLGAQYYVSVNFDKQTEEIIKQYSVIEKTPQYVIVDLTKKL